MKKIILFSTILYTLNVFPMFRALNTAATGMSAQEQNVSAISNNIANLNTTGFKKGRTEFEDLLIINHDIHLDDRGLFKEVFRKDI